MNKIKLIQNLIDELNYQTYLYDSGEERISDKDWDELYFQLVELEKETGIIYPNSPTQKINYDVVNELQKVEHNHPMLSLQKSKDYSDIDNFIDDKHFVATTKCDGLTISAWYEQGKLKRLDTRGDSLMGNDVTHLANAIKNLPKRINYLDTLVVDGEAVILNDDFEKIKNKYNFSNSRNAVAGSMNLLDTTEANNRNISFIAWDVIKGFNNENFYSDKMNQLGKLGFTIVPMLIDNEYSSIENPKNTEDFVLEIKNLSIKQGIPIDGVVFIIDGIEDAKEKGAGTAHHCAWKYALKFYDEAIESKLINIKYDVSRNSILTPVAIFEPVEIDGAVISRCSLHNLTILEEKLGTKPFVGQKIWISRRNMVIPYIERAEVNNG